MLRADSEHLREGLDLNLHEGNQTYNRCLRRQPRELFFHCLVRAQCPFWQRWTRPNRQQAKVSALHSDSVRSIVSSQCRYARVEGGSQPRSAQQRGEDDDIVLKGSYDWEHSISVSVGMLTFT